MRMRKAQLNTRVLGQTKDFIEDLVQICPGLNRSTAIDLLVDIVSGNFISDDITKHYKLIFKDLYTDGRKKI